MFQYRSAKWHRDGLTYIKTNISNIYWLMIVVFSWFDFNSFCIKNTCIFAPAFRLAESAVKVPINDLRSGNVFVLEVNDNDSTDSIRVILILFSPNKESWYELWSVLITFKLLQKCYKHIRYVTYAVKSRRHYTSRVHASFAM